VNFGLMTRTIVLAVLLFFVSAAPWGGGSRFLSPSAAFALDDAERLWLVGSHAYDDGLYGLSGRMLERLIDRFPRDAHVPEATLLLGKVRLSQKQFQPALEAFRRAAGFTPPPGRPGEPRFWEAEALFRMKRYSDARERYEQVVADYETSPIAADALYGLAWTDLELKQREVATADFRRLLFSYPEHAVAPSATFYLARTLVDLKRPDEAVPLLRSFPTKYPDHRLVPESRYLLGQALLAAGDNKEGLNELRAFVQAYPTHELAPQARRLSADAIAKKGTKAEQAEEYKQLLAQSPPTAEGLYEAGVIATRLGRPRDADAAWVRLRKEFPNHALAGRSALESAQVAFTANNFKEASALLQSAAKSSEAAVRDEALVLLGESELRLKRYPTAYQAFQQAVEAPGIEPGLRFRSLAGIGLVMEEQRQWVQAAKYYDEVAAKSPDKTLRAWAKDRRAAIAPKLKAAPEPKAAPRSAVPAPRSSKAGTPGTGTGS
jgi:TolA-binding protein